jgi:hypothetical protein
MAKPVKKYIITNTRGMLTPRSYASRPLTLAEAVDYYRYTLSAGKSYQHERGNKKVNTAPTTIKGLITALNNAAYNCSAGDHYYTYQEAVEEVA